MKRLLFIILFMEFLRAQSGYADAFMNIGISPRAVGLGQAIVALPQHSGGYLINPAATGYLRSPTVNAMFVNQFGLADYLAVGLSFPIGQTFQCSIQGVSLYVGNIMKRPDLRTILDLETRRDSIKTLVERGFDSFADWEAALTINLSKNINYLVDLGWQLAPFTLKIPIGLNVKLINKDLYNYKGVGIGVDFGGMFIVNLDQIFLYNWLGEMVFGLSVSNIAGTRVYWNTKKEDLIPMQLISGMSYRQHFGQLPLGMTVFLQRNNLYSDELRYGMEFDLFDIINLRGGYSGNSIQGGIGLVFRRMKKPVSIGYSFASHDLGNSHRIGGWIEF